MSIYKFIGLSLLSSFLIGAPSARGEDAPFEPFTLEKCITRIETQEAGPATKTRESKQPLGASEIAPTATTAVALVASDSDGRGFISFSHNTLSSTGMADGLTLKITAPFSNNDNQATFASLGQLSGDITATGSFSRFIWDLSPRDYGRMICQACADAGIDNLFKCNQTDLAEALKAKGFSDQEIAKKNDELQGALSGMTVGKLWGLDASVGRKERTFFDLDAKKETDSRAGYSFAAVGGMIFRQWSAYGKVTGKRDYMENDKATFCTPISGGVLENCTSQPFGRAKQVDSLILATEARYFFQTFAIAPSAQYDFDSTVWKFEAPVFLVRNDSGGFTGGFKLFWQTDQKHLGAAIFVTKPLVP